MQLPSSCCALECFGHLLVLTAVAAGCMPAGGNPDLGRQAALESGEALAKAVAGAEMVGVQRVWCPGVTGLDVCGGLLICVDSGVVHTDETLPDQ